MTHVRVKTAKLFAFIDKLRSSKTATPQTSIGEKQRWKVIDKVSTSPNNDGLVLLHIPSGRVFKCNRTGSRIWQALTAGRNLESLADEMSQDFAVARDMLRQHIDLFVSELERQGFVRRMAGC